MAAGTPRRSVLGLVFLTVLVDLIGFSVVFPLYPAMLEHYLAVEGEASLVGRLAGALERVVGDRAGAEFAVVTLFGGALGSLYSALQFLAAPFWGALSDRIGRRPTLLVTLAGTALSYALWFFAGGFALLVAARVLGGVMAGNISTASAVVADVSAPHLRARNMAVIGAAVGVGFTVGPALGALANEALPVLAWWPGGAALGVNPFSGAALAAFALALLNVAWAARRFPETLPGRAAAGVAAASAPEPEPEPQPQPVPVPAPEPAAPAGRTLRPFRALAELRAPGLARANLAYLAYMVAFSAMEFTLVFLATERFGFGPRQNGWMFAFVGLSIALVQGGFVRRYAPRIGEKPLALAGLALLVPGFLAAGFGPSVAALYLGLALLSVGSACVVPALSALASLYAPAARQGLALGTFRSLGSLGRAVGPLLGGVLYWSLGPAGPYGLGAAALLVPLALAAGLPPVPGRGPGPAPGPAPGRGA